MEDLIVTFLELSCLVNLILLGAVVMITRALEARELEIKGLKRKVQGIKDAIKKL